ncbi:hypothetical protein [Streptomyces albofaciens]|uniref:hypothetical protein n=1 Tax=Streptomyces albofaciens TaxID=66866 RepID=UPI000AA74375|nr:hypothetical protein [Streptomyces albofaciens]
MDDSHQPDDESPWASLSPWERALAAFGMTGLILGVVTAVLAAVLLGLLAVAAASLHLVEADGIGTLLWGVALFLPCNALAALFIYPLRLGLRLTSLAPRTKKATEAALSVATTFLAVLFTEYFTPGLRVQHPWLPALLAALLVVLANLAVRKAERRTSNRAGGKLL